MRPPRTSSARTPPCATRSRGKVRESLGLPVVDHPVDRARRAVRAGRGLGTASRHAMPLTIIAIETTGRSPRARRLRFDHAEPRLTSASVVKLLGLAEGDVWDEQQLERGASSEAEPELAKERAFRMLGYRERSPQRCSRAARRRVLGRSGDRRRRAARGARAGRRCPLRNDVGQVEGSRGVRPTAHPTGARRQGRRSGRSPQSARRGGAPARRARARSRCAARQARDGPGRPRQARQAPREQGIRPADGNRGSVGRAGPTTTSRELPLP